MLNDKKIVVVMPAYNAATTLERTYREIPHDIVDDVIVVDDKSNDDTVEVARGLGIEHVIAHEKNTGYGGNQKSCYKAALDLGADVVIMLHPDYQYTPKLCLAMASLLSQGTFDCALGSRILGKGAVKGGMPRYKFIANRLLTALQNILLNYKLSEYHTGYRAFTREVLERLPLESNSDNFLFDNQMLAQVIYAGFDIGEITCPTRYEEDSSSISFIASSRYGIGVVATSLAFCCHRWGLRKSRLFAPLDDE
ncbi:MAG: glycosyltransferase family 2 protein [Lysobacterales bacterium]|jgi:glycosyltransferase involved in cell wall biosynthesis